MGKFLIGVIIGIFIGGGGHWAITQYDLINAGKNAVSITQETATVLDKYVDPSTKQQILNDITKQQMQQQQTAK